MIIQVCTYTVENVQLDNSNSCQMRTQSNIVKCRKSSKISQR